MATTFAAVNNTQLNLTLVDPFKIEKIQATATRNTDGKQHRTPDEVSTPLEIGLHIY